MRSAIALPVAFCACIPQTSVEWPFQAEAGTFIASAKSHEVETFDVLSAGDAVAITGGPETLLRVASFEPSPDDLGLEPGPISPSAEACKLPDALEIYSYSDRQGWVASTDLGGIAGLRVPCPANPCPELAPRIFDLGESGDATVVAPLDGRRTFIVNLVRSPSTSAGFAYLFEAPDTLRPLGSELPVAKSVVRGRSVFATVDDGTSTGPTHRYDLDQISRAIDRGEPISTELVASSAIERPEAMAASPSSAEPEVFALNGNGDLLELTSSGWELVSQRPSQQWMRRGMAWLEPGVIVEAQIEVDADPVLRSRDREEPLPLPRTPGSQIWSVLEAPGLGPVVTTFHPAMAEVFDLRTRERLWAVPSKSLLEFERFRAVAASGGVTLAAGHQSVLEFIKALPAIGSDAVCPFHPLSQGMRWERIVPLGGGFLVTGRAYAAATASSIAFVEVK